MKTSTFFLILFSTALLSAQSIVGSWTSSSIIADFYADSTYSVLVGSTPADSGTYSLPSGRIEFHTVSGIGCMAADSGSYNLVFIDPNNVTVSHIYDECSLRGTTLGNVTFTRVTTIAQDNAAPVNWSIEFQPSMNSMICTTSELFTHFSIIDIAGNTVFASDATILGRTTITIPSLPKGMYVFRISNNNKSVAKKWIM
ncbi:MAG: hypothetical protein CVU11_00130 [Bacteroidetes bacterium HGW-Bacteroidetes-6]|jgi:hypothetical protein|nr:MAG: hypothetical protein CVU11_00130 [Bacteroidetes bacterium HGW-Bacteroidetes-6]